MKSITRTTTNVINENTIEKTNPNSPPPPVFELQFISHPEGYAEPNTLGTFDYIYQYKDHLGNIRLSYKNNGNMANPDLDILEENNFYPFGLKQKGYNNNVTSTNIAQNYKYNGKELSEEFGLNWHDYGARRYDASIGRWMSTDPYAEKYETLSPYAYVSNNPVNAIDPDGRLIVFVNGLLFGEAFEWKTSGSRRNGRYSFRQQHQYPPERNFYKNQEPSMFGKELDYWGRVDDIIADHFGDDINSQSLYIYATDDFHSQAEDRFAQGQASGLELIEGLKNGTIQLENGETIKIVGHSQGAAFAAGMLSSLMDSEYASLVEAGIYLSPHQPGNFENPDGVTGYQFSTETDKVSSGYGNGLTGDLLNLLFNGSSDYKRIKGVKKENMTGRKGHGSDLGGHEVYTWESILQAYNFAIGKDDEN
jgi:RHS repeat-associated protein